MGRVSNAIEIVSEFGENRAEAKLIFEGASVTWPAKLADEEQLMGPMSPSVQYP